MASKGKAIRKAQKVKYTLKGQIPVYDQYGNVIQSAGLIDVTTERDVNWFKFWLADVAGVLKVLGNAKMEVFSYLIENVNRSNNEVGGTMEEIAEKVKVNVKTVHETINLLLECDFMRKVRVATYQINPDIMAYGSSEKRGMLIIRYGSLSDKTPLEEEIDTVSQEKIKSFEKEAAKKVA